MPQANAPHFLRGILFHFQNDPEPGQKNIPFKKKNIVRYLYIYFFLFLVYNFVKVIFIYLDHYINFVKVIFIFGELY